MLSDRHNVLKNFSDMVFQKSVSRNLIYRLGKQTFAVCNCKNIFRPGSWIDNPPSLPASLTDTALKEILVSFGGNLMQDFRSAVAGIEKLLDGRLGAADKKLTCEYILRYFAKVLYCCFLRVLFGCSVASGVLSV